MLAMKNATIRRASTWIAAAAAASLVSMASPDASAQEAAGEADSVSGDGKGIVGGALLGGELVTITMGIIGVEDGWPYFVFGGLGAVGGALGGFAVEQADPPAEAPLFMLAGGLTLIVPALVISLNAVADDDPVEETPPSDSERAEPPQPAPGAPAAPPASGSGSVNLGAQREAADPSRKVARSSRPRATPRARGAVDLGSERLELGVPAVQVQPLYTQQEISRYGVTQGTEVRVPVISAAF
jgi:hypothetical protein